MSNFYDKVNKELLLDALKEVGNIGTGNALTALAKMLEQKVDTSVPKVNILNFYDIPKLVGGEEVEVCGIYFQIDGDIDGTIMFLATIESADELINFVMPGGTKEQIDEFKVSALSEVGNILAGAYVSSLSALTGLDLRISVPSLTIDMAGAILSVLTLEFGLAYDKILIIENEFAGIDLKDALEGYFFLIPSAESYDTLFNSLGIKYE